MIRVLIYSMLSALQESKRPLTRRLWLMMSFDCILLKNTHGADERQRYKVDVQMCVCVWRRDSVTLMAVTGSSLHAATTLKSILIQSNEKKHLHTGRLLQYVAVTHHL